MPDYFVPIWQCSSNFFCVCLHISPHLPDWIALTFSLHPSLMSPISPSLLTLPRKFELMLVHNVGFCVSDTTCCCHSIARFSISLQASPAAALPHSSFVTLKNKTLNLQPALEACPKTTFFCTRSMVGISRKSQKQRSSIWLHLTWVKVWFDENDNKSNTFYLKVPFETCVTTQNNIE